MFVSVACTLTLFMLLDNFNAQWKLSHTCSPGRTPTTDGKPDYTFVILKTQVERPCIVFCFLVPVMWCDCDVMLALLSCNDKLVQVTVALSYVQMSGA